MSNKSKFDLQIIIASGPHDIGRAVFGFAFGASAAVSNIRVKVILALEGAAWAKKNEPAARKGVNGFGPISEYMNILAESKAVVSLCSTCAKNACLTQRRTRSSFYNLPASGLSELALAACGGKVATVVF